MSFFKKTDLIKFKEKSEQREYLWQNLFNKYENADESQQDTDSYISVEDIVKTYGKTKINNGKENRGVGYNSKKVESCSRTGKKTRMTKESNNKPFIELQNNLGINETFRKRGRPPIKNNTMIRIEDNEKIHRKSSRPKLLCNGNDELEELQRKRDESKFHANSNIKTECDELEANAETEISVKRGRPFKKNNSQFKIEEIDISDVSKVINDVTINKKRGRPPKKNNSQLKIDKIDISAVSEINNITLNKKRGRPSKKNNSQLKIEEIDISTLSDTNNVTLNKKRGRPSKKNNSQLKIEEIDISAASETNNVTIKRKRGRPRLKTIQKAEAEDETLVNNDMENISNTIKHVMVQKRASPSLKSIKAETSAVKANKKSSSPTYQKYIIHSFWKKELKKKYSGLIDNEKRFSRSFTADVSKLNNKNSRRSKSCINYSEKSLRVFNLFSGKKTPRKNLSPKSKNKTFLTPKKSSKVSCISQFNTASLDSNMSYIKYVIEEELKSNLGLLIIKRYQSRKSEDKENNFTFYHKAVKKELMKLHRIISMEKLTQYMEWYIRTWFSH